MKIINFLNQYRIYLLFISLSIFILVLSLLSQGTYGGSDDYVHYRFARYAFKYPHFLLDHWAKPVFTLLASPFAQFGYFGIKLFNFFAGIATAWFSYKVSQKIGLKQSWVGFVFVLFAPIYLSLVLSGLTEILFSFVLIFSVYLCITKKFVIAALILSFLPFVRTEGIVLIPFFVLYFITNKKYIIIPLFLTGILIYTFIGGIYYGDMFWLINKMPYTGAKNIYGSGSLMHFVNSSKSVFGIPLVLLLITGFLTLIVNLFHKNTGNISEIFLLILLPFITFIAFHSLLWWLGAGGSLGLTRVLASVVPLAAILATIGTDSVILFFKKKWIRYVLSSIILYLVISTPFNIYKFPVPLNDTEKLIRKTADWVSKNGFDKQRIYYYNPYYCHYKGIDPYDTNLAWEQLPNREIPSKDMMIGSIVIWDSQFGPNEGRLPVEKILNDSLMQLLKVFRPVNPFQVLNGYNYEICIFKRIEQQINTAENYKKYNENPNPIEDVQILKILDFEDSDPVYNGFNIIDTISYSGKKSCLIRSSQEFGPTIVLDIPIHKTQGQQIIESEIHYLHSESLNPENILLTTSIEHKNKLYFYQVQQGNKTNNHNNWGEISLSVILPEIKGENDLLKIYIWNKNSQNIIVDNFSIKTGVVK